MTRVQTWSHTQVAQPAGWSQDQKALVPRSHLMHCDLKVQRSLSVVHVTLIAGYRPVRCVCLRAKISLSSSYALSYPLVSWLLFLQATYSTAEIMKYETKDLDSNPGSISIPFMPHFSGPQFVHSTYLMDYQED